MRMRRQGASCGCKDPLWNFPLLLMTAQSPASTTKKTPMQVEGGKSWVEISGMPEGGNMILYDYLDYIQYIHIPIGFIHGRYTVYLQLVDLCGTIVDEYVYHTLIYIYIHIYIYEIGRSWWGRWPYIHPLWIQVAARNALRVQCGG